jgi:hypothetical protein
MGGHNLYNKVMCESNIPGVWVDMRKVWLLLAGLFGIIILARYAMGRYEFLQGQGVTEIFIIRGSGSSYMDFNFKFFLVIALIALVLYDWKKNKRLDYFWISVICALGIPLEAIIQLTGERLIQANYLFGIPLPYVVQLPLQVLAEASFDTAMVLFFADMMLKAKTRKRAMIAFSAVMIAWFAFILANGIQTPNYGGEVPSRRVMSGTGELAVIFTGTYVVLAFFLTKGRYLRVTPSIGDRRRGLYLLTLLVIYGTVGTIGMYVAGVRWVEIGGTGSTQHAQPLVEFAAFAYNVTFEYAFAYSLSYVILVGLKLITNVGHQKAKSV